MILVYKTTVETESEVAVLRPEIEVLKGIKNWNFDLEDCDRILRIDCEFLLSERVISILKEKGFSCEELLY